MLFFLSAAEYVNVQNNTTKVKVHLTGGIAEILDKHQDLMGRIDNNIIEIETFFENRFEKMLFVLQDAVFVVSNKGLGADKEKNQTAVYVYAKRAREISSSLSIDEVIKQYEKVVKQLEILKEKVLIDSGNSILKGRIVLVEEEVDFFVNLIALMKGLKG
jgi:ABC-type ATPase with predicted acetyltransferase domain